VPESGAKQAIEQIPRPYSDSVFHRVCRCNVTRYDSVSQVGEEGLSFLPHARGVLEDSRQSARRSHVSPIQSKITEETGTSLSHWPRTGALANALEDSEGEMEDLIGVALYERRQRPSNDSGQNTSVHLVARVMTQQVPHQRLGMLTEGVQP
jgi:hypothetical protein